MGKKLLEGMEKYIRVKPGRKSKPWLSISKSGWATITDALDKELSASASYKSVDFFIKPNDKDKNIGLVLYKDSGYGELLLRARKPMPNPVGCGFCLMRLIRHKPEYIGYYEVKEKSVDTKSITVLLKPVNKYV